MKIKRKLVSAFVAVALLATLGIIPTLNSLKEISTHIRHITASKVREMREAAEMAFAFAKIDGLAKEHLLATFENKPDKTAGIKRELDKYLRVFENSIKTEQEAIELDIKFSSEEEEEEEEELQTLERLKANFASYKKDLNEFLAIPAENNYKEASRFYKESLVKKGEVLLGDIRWFEQDTKSEIAEETEDTLAETAFVVVLSYVTVVATFSLATGMGWFISKILTKPVVQLSRLANKIGDGNLSVKIDVKTNDEIGLLADSFEKMVENLKNSIDNLNDEVAERKKAEKSLRRLNEKLERNNAELKSFVYIASHDLREPLRKISSFGLLLEKSLNGKISADDTENLGYMIDGADRMTKMIEALLAYLRITTKNTAIEDVDLNRIIEQLKNLELALKIEETKAAIEVPEPLPVVNADFAQMHQLLQNLIANAIKYQVKGNKPHITITAKPAGDKMVRIEVSDNGIGIKPEYHRQIFEMFRRLHSRNEYEGTGIGLSICQKIVEQYGGQIGIESEYGKGSTFWFTVPAAQQATLTTTVVPFPLNNFHFC